MDSRAIDDLARRLAALRSRRDLVRMLAGGAGGGLLALRRAGRGNAASERIPLCHFTGDPANPYAVIEVAGPALANHQAHGDFRFTNCCRNADCDGGNPCVDGTCRTCTPIGFEPENACTASTTCCDGGQCVNFPTFQGAPSFCRPAGCLLGGAPCTDISACCSFTCSGETCQQ